ncbi:MAG: hypothetical protein FJ104_11925 [Deltaproteobacteria bacterium]|nr:hypothetical protein [Deltaproteobacteria bacterium]
MRFRHLLPTTAALAAIAIGAATAGAAPGPARYVVQSAVLTIDGTAMGSSVTTATGAQGTMTMSVKGTLKLTSADGEPVTLNQPELLNQYLCSPNCPQFVAGGQLTIVEVFTPAGKGAKKTCRSTKTLREATPAEAYVASSKTSTKILKVRLGSTKNVSEIYAAARGTCALPPLYPVDSYDFTAFGETTLPATQLGASTMTIKLRNSLRPPSYPAGITGKTAVTATVVLARKS